MSAIGYLLVFQCIAFKIVYANTINNSLTHRNLSKHIAFAKVFGEPPTTEIHCLQNSVGSHNKYSLTHENLSKHIAFAKVFGEPPTTEIHCLQNSVVSHHKYSLTHENLSKHIAFAKVFGKPPTTEIASRLLVSMSKVSFYFTLFYVAHDTHFY